MKPSQPENDTAGERVGRDPQFAWEHQGMRVTGGRLLVAGRDAEALAREHGTPLWVFDLTRIGEVARGLRRALQRAGLRPRVRLALKALHEAPALDYLRRLAPPGDPAAVGIDACSPGEVQRALAHGFLPSEISFTGTNVSERDLDVIAPAAVHINVDLLTQIERVGRRCPGRAIGLRINPRAGVMRGHATSLYAGARPTKFGIYEEQLDDAVTVATRHGLTIDTVHFHLANRMLNSELPAFDEALAAAERLVSRLVAAGCPIAEVNAGGGLGTPLHPGEEPLDLDAYAGILARTFGDLGVAVGVEPGEYLTNEAGLLLAEVVTVEERLGETFVGLDAGWNVLNDHKVYGRELQMVPVTHADEPARLRVTVSGHINEGDDLFAQDYPLAEVAEGDIVAIVSCGGYCPGMWTDHCERPRAARVFFAERAADPGAGPERADVADFGSAPGNDLR
jgi:diaminopimelate decarboxylase